MSCRKTRLDLVIPELSGAFQVWEAGRPGGLRRKHTVPELAAQAPEAGEESGR